MRKRRGACHAPHDHLLHRLVPGDAGGLRLDRVSRALAGLIVLVLAVSACGDPTKVESGDRRGPALETETPEKLLRPPVGPGITVLPVGGAAAGDGTLARAMAGALRDQGITARVGAGNTRTRWLMGTAAPSRDGVSVTWELYDAAGERQLRATQQLDSSPGGADPDALARAARPVAERMAKAVQQRPARPRTRSPQGLPADVRVAVKPATGSPTAGARALAPALASALRQRGLPLVDQAAPGDIVIRGELGGDTLPNGGRRLAITWTVLEAGREEPLGDLTQRNTVPPETLERGWEPLARSIAQGAAPGVVRLLRRVARARSDGA